MTKYSVKYAQNYGVFKEVALFSENVPHSTLVRFCEDLLTEIDNCTAVEAVDLETGAIFYDVYAKEDSDNCDNDCGFDPFIGLFTYDV